MKLGDTCQHLARLEQAARHSCQHTLSEGTRSHVAGRGRAPAGSLTSAGASTCHAVVLVGQVGSLPSDLLLLPQHRW